jgi:hypothetical protein
MLPHDSISRLDTVSDCGICFGTSLVDGVLPQLPLAESIQHRFRARLIRKNGWSDTARRIATSTL